VDRRRHVVSTLGQENRDEDLVEGADQEEERGDTERPGTESSLADQV
jgi:hypothetical protein